MSMPRWTSDLPHIEVSVSPMGWIRVVLRGLALIVVVFGALLLMLVLRLVEQPIYGMQRPFTPYLTVGVCRISMRIIGLRHVVHGSPMKGPGAVVANHTSWLDIFVLNATKRIYFVAKEEVSGWAGIGWLARVTGTLFIRRDRAQARAQAQEMQNRLLMGHKLLFFPEGTSTDGQQVVPFKSTLFQAFFADELRDTVSVQPVSLRYHAPDGTDPRYYGWWGEMSFGGSLPALFSPARHGVVEVTYHAPLPVRDFDNRKVLALEAETIVRAGHAASKAS